MASDPHDDRRSGIADNAIAFLTREAARAPMVALTLGLRAWEQSRPVRAMALRRGNEVLQIVAHTPLGRFLPQPVHDDDADAEAERIGAAARQATAMAAARKAAHPATAPSGERSATPAPKPAAPPPPDPDDVPKAEKELPIPDFDNISIGSLRARLRNLTVDDLEALRAWEQTHANRVQVVTLLTNRIAKVSTS